MRDEGLVNCQDALNSPPLHVLSPVHVGPKSKMTKVMKAGACFSGGGGGLLVSSQSLINHSTYFSCKQPPGANCPAHAVLGMT